MKMLLRAFAAIGVFTVTTAFAAEGGCGKDCASSAEKTAWEFALTAYPTTVRGGDHYTSAIATADRGPLHFEARYNYEALGARSAFIGWTFSGGERIAWELRPLIGGAWGEIEALVPGLEASLAWGRVDVYVEAEYVRDRNKGRDDSYFYSWNELGYRAAEWLRLGLAAQRTRSYNNDRDIQRGPFAQLTRGRATLGAYWFNPGSADQVFVGSLGVTF